MEDGDLEWNSKKCSVINIKRGKIDMSKSEMVLNDGTKIGCLKSEDLYKFLGVPENMLHDVDNITTSLKKVIRQRTYVIWTSPLSDYNKVMATNIFVISSAEYFMWSEKFNIGVIREMDQIVRDVLNNVHAKYSLQINASLYLPRNKGGRGLRKFETTYKKIRMKTAMNLLTSRDPRMACVRKFEKKRMQGSRSSVIKDAMKYAEEDFDMRLEPLENDFVMHYQTDEGSANTSQKQKVSTILKYNDTQQLLKEVCSATWQGVIINNRFNDPYLIREKCFMWLTSWKDCPVKIINDFQSIYLQTVPTLTFKKYRGHPDLPTLCRLCLSEAESIKHLLSHCSKFVGHGFKRRHDRVLQYIMFNFLSKNGMISSCPAWYTKICIKPKYENENTIVYWDIPEYSGYEDQPVQNPLRPDGKIIMKTEKSIFVLEMTVPWIENRETKLNEKIEKYKGIIQNIKIDNPGYNVQQLTFVMDCLGGYSDHLVASIKLLKFTKSERDSILSGIQKIIVTEATSLINHFKILTKQ